MKLASSTAFVSIDGALDIYPPLISPHCCLEVKVPFLQLCDLQRVAHFGKFDVIEIRSTSCSGFYKVVAIHRAQRNTSLKRQKATILGLFYNFLFTVTTSTMVSIGGASCSTQCRLILSSLFNFGQLCIAFQQCAVITLQRWPGTGIHFQEPTQPSRGVEVQQAGVNQDSALFKASRRPIT